MSRPFIIDDHLSIGGASTSVVAKIKKTISMSSNLQLVRGHLSRSLVGDQFIGELLPFLEIPQSGAFNGGNVDEDILPTIVGLNETEAFGGVEPLHCTVCHDELLFPCVEDRSDADALSGVVSKKLGRGHQLAHDTGVSVRCGLNVQPKIDGLNLGPATQDVKAL